MPERRTVVYSANAASNDITAYAVDPSDGGLTLVGRVDVGAIVGPLLVAPGGEFAYAQRRGARAEIAAFAIDRATGALDPIATTPLPHELVYLQIDRSGRFLLGASYTQGVFTIHAIAADGRVVDPPVQVTATPPQAHCIGTDRANRFLLVTSLGGDVILVYRFDATTGRAVPNDPPAVATAPGSGPRHLVFHPHGDYVYVNGELDGSLSVFAFDPATGRLNPAQRIGLMPADSSAAPWAADVHLTPDGRFMYASERRTSTLAVLAVHAGSGLLELREIRATQAQPRSLALDPGGKFLFVAGELSDELTTYAIDPANGALAARGRRQVGRKPSWIGVVALSDGPAPAA